MLVLLSRTDVIVDRQKEQHDMSRQTCIVSLLVLILLAGCKTSPTLMPVASNTARPPTATDTIIFPTETNAPITATPTLSTPLTPQPITGIVRIATNVRTLPNKNLGERIGGLFPNETVQVIGRNEDASWLWITYTQAPEGTAWVTARAIDLKGEMGHLAIVIGADTGLTPQVLPPFLYTITGTPLPLNLPPAGALTARVNYITNVRVGPGTGFVSIGTLLPGSVVTLTGRLKNNSWLQIDYPSGPGHRAWISANVLTLDGNPSILPIYNLLGTPVADENNGTPAPIIPLPGTLPSGPSGKTVILLNVRLAPDQNSQAIGVLKPQTQVVILGRTQKGDWYLIQFASAPNGRAWVAAEFIEILSGDIDSLPLYDEQGNPLGGL